MNTLTASDACVEASRRLGAVALDDLVAEAELLTRVDRKHLLDPKQALAFLGALGSRTRVLEIDGIRAFAYESVYFDTPDLRSHRLAATGRRRRFKVRSRAYLETGAAYLEVKTKGARGITVKDRIPLAFEDRDRLTAEGRAYASEELARIGLGSDVVDALAPVLVTRYRRTTLLSSDGARATIDTDPSWVNAAGRVLDAPGLVIVETKSAGRGGEFDAVLRRLGIRASSISKFGTGLAAMHPELLSNKWTRTIARHLVEERRTA